MRNKLSFATFDPLFSDAPSLCDVCETKPSVFQFENRNSDDSTECPTVKGFCCAPCATLLLKNLQRAESLTWAEEEVSVQAEDVDVADFHKRRLATFGTLGRN
jgi:hypothetical protein